jgi:hypothetical protein
MVPEPAGCVSLSFEVGHRGDSPRAGPAAAVAIYRRTQQWDAAGERARF